MKKSFVLFLRVFRKSCGLKAIGAENPGGLQAAFRVPITAASGSTDAKALTRRLCPKSHVALAYRHSIVDTTLKHHLPGGARGLGGLAAKPPKERLSLPNLPTRFPEAPFLKPNLRPPGEAVNLRKKTSSVDL